jgi:hypothetical protein
VAAHHAVIHDDVESGRPGALGRGFIHDPVLQPDRASPDGNRLVDDWPGELGAAKDLDDVDRLR